MRFGFESQSPCNHSVTHGACHGDTVFCGSDGCVEEDCVKSQLHRNCGIGGCTHAGIDNQRNGCDLFTQNSQVRLDSGCRVLTQSAPPMA